MTADTAADPEKADIPPEGTVAVAAVMEAGAIKPTGAISAPPSLPCSQSSRCMAIRSCRKFRSGPAERGNRAPGSIYPTLQQLADEGLVTSTDEGGRNIFTLTEAGSEVNEDTTSAPPWEELAGTDNFVEMRQTASSLMGATKQIAQVGSPEQVTAATEILTEARQRLYQLLAD